MNISFDCLESLKNLKTNVLVKIVDKKFVTNYIKKSKPPCRDVCFCEKDPLQQVIYDSCFKGELGEFAISSLPHCKVVFFGIGDIKEPTEFEGIGCSLYTYLKTIKAKNISVLFNADIENETIKYNNQDNYISLINGFLLTVYEFNKYMLPETQKKKKKQILLDNIVFLTDDVKKIEKQYKELNLIIENVFFCRDLINEPSNVIYPESFVNIIKGIGKLGLEIEILDEKQLKKIGAGGILSVGQGSNNPPYMVVIKYNGSKKDDKPLTFVGKGVCFDSGGLSLKPSSSMEMKCDMSGAAVVVSLMKLLAERKAKVNAIGCVALVENMPSGTASKIQDIVKTLSGQTIEILNTDAEGRVILADALYYVANTYKPDVMIDLATLTSAICVALGDRYTGLFTNDHEIFEKLRESGQKTGEQVWQMPISPIGKGYDKMIDSEWADVKNVGERDAGSITAAQFLQRFIKQTPSWVHLDIAATAYIKKNMYFVEKGATGWGVRLLNQFIKDNYE